MPIVLQVTSLTVPFERRGGSQGTDLKVGTSQLIEAAPELHKWLQPNVLGFAISLLSRGELSSLRLNLLASSRLARSALS